MRFWKIMLITFGCMLILFVILAFIFGGKIFNSGTPENNDEPTYDVDGETGYNKDILNLLLVGTDYQPDVFSDYTEYDNNGIYRIPRSVYADTILLVKIDGVNKSVIITSVPSNLVVNSDFNITLAEIYSTDGIDKLETYIRAKTGIVVDCYGIISIPDCVKVLDKLGNINFKVPCDMNYTDPTQNLEIKLKGGMQSLTASQIVSMLRFNSFENSEITREAVAESFVKSMIKKFSEPVNIIKVPGLIRESYEYFETNVSLEEFLKNMNLFSDINGFEVSCVSYPFTVSETDGKKYAFDSSSDDIENYKEYLTYRSKK